MMRSVLPLGFVLILVPAAWGQTRDPEAGEPANVASRQQPADAAPKPPFNPPDQQELAQLQRLLAAWEAQSKGTKTLECAFKRWSYAPGAAPSGVPKDTSTGVIKYAAPDKGLFKVEHKVFFAGMNDDGKPLFTPQPGQYGEWWVCNGKELIEFDRSREECRIQTLPPDMQGQQIFNSPLPFVFNLDAEQIRQRYWVRQVAAPKPGIVLIEAWPKRQEDRAQYRLVQIALDEETMIPSALVMYAPNFDIKTNPEWDHYEFTSCNRNGKGQWLQNFWKGFIDEKPPSDWKVLRNHFVPPPNAQRTAEAADDPNKSIR